MHVLSMWRLQDGAGVMAGFTLAGPAHALGALVMAGAAGNTPQAGLDALASLMLDAADPGGRDAAAVVLLGLAGRHEHQEAVAQAALPAIAASLEVWPPGGNLGERAAGLLGSSAQQPATAF